MKFLSYLGLPVITLCSMALGNTIPNVIDYFKVPGPIVYTQTPFHLSWSAHPTANYYKQEYIPANEKSETFSHMVMIEVLVGDISVTDAVNAKVAELKQRKKTDPATNYQVIENKVAGEYLLDFVITQSSGGSDGIAEWNAYRYVKLNDKNGKKGILLFAISKRGYGQDVPNFLKKLKTDRQTEINSLLGYKLPGISIKAG